MIKKIINIISLIKLNFLFIEEGLSYMMMSLYSNAISSQIFDLQNLFQESFFILNVNK